MPAGTLQGVTHITTPDYVMIVAFIDQSLVNLQANDSGGELDPHGADLVSCANYDLFSPVLIMMMSTSLVIPLVLWFTLTYTRPATQTTTPILKLSNGLSRPQSSDFFLVTNAT